MSASTLSRFSSIVIVLAAGALPLGAQQRTEIVLRGVPRSESADSAERQVRRLQRQLDSLSRVWMESEELTLAERRKVEVALGATVERLNELSARFGGAGDRQRPSEMVRVQLSPAQGERARSEMTRAMMQVREIEAAMPRGWIGMVAQGPAREPRVEDGELIVRYFSYPVIVSVDPSSPAQRAGVMPSDTLIAYNGRDVRDNDISITRLLRPEAPISVRLQRDGKVRELHMTVAAAPTRIVQRRFSEAPAAPEQWEVPPVGPFPRMPAPPAPGGSAVRVGGMAPTPSASLPIAVAPMRQGVFTFTNAVLGAQMATITEGLGAAIGVSSGVIVTSAPVGSLANESGLRDGDVIVKVEGRPVASFAQVRSLLQSVSNNGERSLDVEILRNRKSQKLTLRW